MTRWILAAAVIAELLLAWPCLGQPVGGGTTRGFMGVELRTIDERAIEAERSGAARSKLTEEEKSKAQKRAAALKPGVMIVGVRKGGPAEQAGLKPEDIITAANGEGVLSLSDLQRALRELRPGGSAELAYLRIGADGSVTQGKAKVVAASGAELVKLTEVDRGPATGGFNAARILPGQLVESFDALPAGQSPNQWVAGRTGGGAAAAWEVAAMQGSEKNVLRVARPAGQGPATEGAALNLCIFDNAAVGGNMYMRLRMKATGEAKSQAGGLVWNYQDDDNYYMAVLDFRRGAVEVYKVVEGKEILIQSRPCKLKLDEWYEIRPEQTVGRVQIWMGKPSKVVLKSERDLTFEGGKVGVVTRGDSAVMFDEISARRTPSPGGI